ncbi:phosphonate ABC transporter substrate-binding protein, partial [Rhizobium ruizarguesonis]
MLKKALFAATALFALVGAAHAADLKEFRIGILGGENETDRLRNYACLADHLKQEFGFEKVSLFPAADYDGVIQGLLGGTLDFAELGASGYAAVYIKDSKAVTPILTTQQKDGSTGYYSIGLALKSSGIKSIKDAKGKKLGYADPDSTSGYLVPLTQIPKDTGMPNDKFFASTQFNGGHENNLLAAYDGKVDIAVDDSSGIGDFKDGYTSGTFRKEVDKGAVDPNKLVEVWRSPLIPNGPLVVRNALGEEWQTKLAAFFTALPEKDHKCFAAVEGGDYK